MNKSLEKMFYNGRPCQDIFRLNYKFNIVIVSGYFNPLHLGHIKYLEEAEGWGAALVAIINNDEQVKAKGSQQFMDETERVEIVSAIRFVDYAVISIDVDKAVCETLRALAKLLPDCRKVFANGGDRTLENIPETEVCEEFGIKMVFGVGGEKNQSSSWLLEKRDRTLAKNAWVEEYRDNGNYNI